MPEDVDWSARGLGYEPPEIDTSRAHPARLYDYLLGGKDNYPPDREAAEQLIKISPVVPLVMRENRLFLHRLTRYLAAEEGIDQFLDIGTGIPTSPNVHEIAQEVNPAARVVYVDNDPIVLAHARARLTSSPEGRVVYIPADMRDAEAILTAPELTAPLDLTRPVALLIISTLHLIPDAGQARELLDQYVDRLAPGSFLALSVVTDDIPAPDESDKAISELAARGIDVLTRTHDEVVELFDGLELVEPGVVRVNRWRPDEKADPLAEWVSYQGGVARKPLVLPTGLRAAVACPGRPCRCRPE
jgi:S-adenosyl methyltransferase